MIRRIVLENYMSHARTVIEPAAGLTVLAGPNNCGKSAVISALLSLRGDGEQAGYFMMRHDESLTTVTVETDDGHVIVWRRKKASVSYVIDGVEIHRIGRGNLPDKLPETLRLPLIEPANSGKRFDLHFGLQKEPIFLIDSEADAARFFSASNDAERLLQMQQLQKERVKAARGDEKKARAELARIDGKLAALSPLGEIDAALAQAERQHEGLVADAHRAAYLRRLIGDLRRQDRERLEQEQLTGALSALKPPPLPRDAPALRRGIGRLDEAMKTRARGAARSEAIGGLLPPPPLSPTAPLAGAIDKLAKATAARAQRRALADALRPLREAPILRDNEILRRWVNTHGYACQSVAIYARTVEAIRPLREAPAQREVAPLAALARKMARLEQRARAARLQRDLLAALPDPPRPLDPAPLRDGIARAEALRRGVEQRRKAHAKTLAEWIAVERMIDQWIQGHPACPVCGGQMDRRRLLAAGEHAHA